MAIISGFISKYYFWKEHFFFVRVSDTSVEASAIPIFRTGWGTKGSQGTAHRSRVFMPASMLLGGIFPMRVRRAVALYRSRFQPDLPTEEGLESSMDGFIPYVPRTKRDRSKPRRDKHITVDEDVVDRQFYPDNILKDYLDSQAGGSNGEQFNLDGLSEFDFPPTIGGSEEVPDFSKAARMVDGKEAQMARSRAEVADKEIARLKDELESSRRHGQESFEKEVNHAYRRGKREIVEVMKSCCDKFSQPFGELKGPGLLAEKDKDPKISEVEDEIWNEWEPVPVSPDMVEAETGGLDETGEVDQPVAALDVNDYSIGGSMSGNFKLGD
ncbi:hypothetical protein DY000_02060051 [Brassica cretica]|uniref:Uncharacterized protein n=1 Tax=Brassica cretica TaxID=69181 RepID=A0ABQ7B0L8_BRACR|nr:hypothetical protein DY000_02060051 [Brassica cretica]